MNLDQLNWKNSEEVTISGQDTSAIIEDVSNTLDYYADKYIITKYPILTGDVVEYEGIRYLITSQIDRNKGNFRARMRQCDFNINFNFDGEIINFASIIYSKIFDTGTGQYLTMPTGKIAVIMENSEDSIEIELGQRFIKLESPWKVVGIDRTRKGLLTLHAEVDTWKENDDRENEIPDYVESEEPEEPIEEDYSITITGADEIEMGNSATYNVEISLGGNIVDEEVVWSVDNASLASITNQNGNSCTLKANSDFNLGIVKLRAELVGDESVFGERDILIKSLF